ncbi:MULTISPECIES: hypothetical protein [unclassified Sphingomonas]|uniref:hypothetical protein n=1 Tax=unclassified Sphingomonas TaxID=196159 RepID=UPI000834ECFB|nr:MULTISPECIES: hypothetical protein [unclassified Sphingomonas]
MTRADDDIIRQTLAALLEHPDHNGWAVLMGDDCHLRIGNRAPAVEKIASLRQLMRLFDALESVGGSFLDYWSCADTLLVETEFTFHAEHGGLGTIPCAIIVRHTSGLIRDIRIMLDPEPIRHRLPFG